MTSSSSSTKLPAYQRLIHDDDLDEDEFDFEKNRVVVRSRTNKATTSWCRFRSFRRAHIRRRSFKLKVPSLRRLLFLRRKVKVVSALYAKVVRRFKEGQSHFGDLFAGNYLFLQINPSSLKALHNKGTPTHHSLQFNKPYALPSNNIA
ncbi:hypothetical protein ACFX2I_023262 [Malus domestica]|uniref:Uncharacterized protein n=1 Tax=Malus domestica TaxID=3750 RepID=A0A498HK80_MALDO|nr:uncharacterized protein LOC103404249 [Malus domestica]XP_050134816.1 uncharacterized protein LOC126610741 [Malus sylvestris]RXH69551.1 hypothetical protein DVH24_037335 [Malus domestica]